MPSPILVTGGTGTLGRQVVPRLREAGHSVRVLSRRPHPSGDGIEHVTGDLATGEGIDAAVDGAGTIIHCAGSNNGDDETTRTLVRAAARPGAPHLVYISVIGADRIPVASRADRVMFGYFASKLAAERVVTDSGLPWTTLRAAQFHDLILMVARQMAKLPVLPVPAGFKFQPVDAGEVADRLVELALGSPAGLVPDLAGPRVYGVAELLRGYLRACGKRRPIVPVWLPGKAARAVRAGANLAPERAVGRRTWEAFLADRLGDSGLSATAAAVPGRAAAGVPGRRLRRPGWPQQAARPAVMAPPLACGGQCERHGCRSGRRQGPPAHPREPGPAARLVVSSWPAACSVAWWQRPRAVHPCAGCGRAPAPWPPMLLHLVTDSGGAAAAWAAAAAAGDRRGHGRPASSPGVISRAATPMTRHVRLGEG